MSCSICGRPYGDPGCRHLLGQEYPNEGLTELARVYLDRPISAIIGVDIEAREQSIVLFPAIPGASVGFNFSDEMYQRIDAVERAKEVVNPDLGEYVVDIAIQLIENRTNNIVVDADEYQAQLTELDTLRAREETNIRSQSQGIHNCLHLGSQIAGGNPSSIVQRPKTEPEQLPAKLAA